MRAAGLVSAELAVLVAERGSYRNESDFTQLEATSLPTLYLTGGFVWTDGASVAMLAGSTVGGGTTVNSMACIAPPGYVLRNRRHSA